MLLEYMKIDLAKECGLKQLVDFDQETGNFIVPNSNSNSDSPPSTVTTKLPNASNLKKSFLGKRCCFHQLETPNLLVGIVVDASCTITYRPGRPKHYEMKFQVAPDAEFELAGQTLMWVDVAELFKLPSVAVGDDDDGDDNDDDDRESELLEKAVAELRQKVKMLAQVM